MSNEKNLPYAVVCGGVNIDIGAHSFAPLRAKDSNPGKVELSLGGVGRNIAHNMRLLGVPTYLLTAVGGDSRASQVEESCKELGIDLSHALRVPDGRTSTYVLVGDSDGDMAVAVADMEICEKLTPDYFASQKELLDGAAAVVVDANLPRESIAYLVEHCAAPLFVDPVSTVKAEKLQGLLSHVHTLKPNRIEAELLSGVKITDDATLYQAAQALLDQGVRLYLLIAVPAVAGLTAVALPLSRFLFPAKYAAGAPVIAYTALAMLFMGLTEYANKAYELEQSTVHVLQNSAIAAVIKVVSSVILLKTLGFTGGALGSVVAFASYFIITCVRVRSRFLFRVAPISLVRIIVSALLCGAAAFACTLLPVGNLIRLGAAVVVGAGVYAVCIIVSGEGREEVQAVLRRLKR